MSESITDRICSRAREEMRRQGLTQRDIGGILKWPQSRVSKILNNQIAMGVEDLGALAFALSISPTELVRDSGLEFCAEMTPTELRTLEKLRAFDQKSRDAFLHFLDIKASTIPERYALKPNTSGGRKKRTG